MPLTSNCRHCGRRIVKEDGGLWVDPEATGDDSVWSETCDAHDTFTAYHEPETTTEQVSTLLDLQLDQYREARDAVAELSVLYTAKLARDHYPTATHVNCEYSDQPGGGLCPKEVVLADRTIVDADGTDFAEAASLPLSNLNEDSEGAWMAFFIIDDDAAGEDIAKDMDAVLLNIDDALTLDKGRYADLSDALEREAAR